MVFRTSARRGSFWRDFDEYFHGFAAVESVEAVVDEVVERDDFHPSVGCMLDDHQATVDAVLRGRGWFRNPRVRSEAEPAAIRCGRPSRPPPPPMP
jgi:hypothetical protein